MPQVGDVVVYCVQGHQQFLSMFPVHEVPPWKTNNWRSPGWPFVQCRVDDLTYEFPPYADSKVIVCNIHLTIVAVPSQPGGNTWIRQRGSRHTSLKRFTVQFQPHHFPEFITLKERFQCGLDNRLKVGDKVTSLFLGENKTQEFYVGEVVEIVDCDPQQWPGSPWDSIKAMWNAKVVGDSRSEYVGDADVVSPWDLQKEGNDAAPWSIALTDNNTCPKEVADVLLDKVTHIMDTEACAEPFIDPVPLESVPSYGSIVPLPMDLSTICQRLRQGYYRHLEAVRADFTLIHDNCLRFNVEKCQISSLAKELLPMLLSAVGEAELEANPSTSNMKSSAPVLSQLSVPDTSRTRTRSRTSQKQTGHRHMAEGESHQSRSVRSTRSSKRVIESTAEMQEQRPKRRKVVATSSSSKQYSTRSSRGRNELQGKTLAKPVLRG